MLAPQTTLHMPAWIIALAVSGSLAVADAPPGVSVDSADVLGLAFSPDGRTLVTIGGFIPERGTVTVWDLPTGKVRAQLREDKTVRAVAFAPDGKTFATGEFDDTVKLRDASSGKVLSVLHGHTGGVNSLAYSPDGAVLASGSLDKTIKLWDMVTQKELRTLRGHSDQVLCVAFSPDGKTLLSGGGDAVKAPLAAGEAKLWDAAAGTELLALKGHARPIECVTFSPDGKTAATAGYDQTVGLWDTATGKETRTLQGHGGPVISLAFSPDGSLLAAATVDATGAGEVKLWAPSSGKEYGSLRGHADFVWAARFSPDGRTLATGGRDRTVRLYEVASREDRGTLSAETAADNAGTADLDPRRPVSLKTEELESLWKDLAAGGRRSYRAVWKLAAAKEAPGFLAKRVSLLKPGEAVTPEQVTQLIAQLDDADFDVREKATVELERLGAAVEKALQKALQNSPSAEARRRMEALLAKVKDPLSRREELRMLRCAEALEYSATPEAREVLKGLSEGREDASLTRDAKAALKRLGR
jgi:WD40 repeat protein